MTLAMVAGSFVYGPLDRLVGSRSEVGAACACIAQNNRCGRKVGSRNDFEQLFAGNLRIFDESETAVDHFAQRIRAVMATVRLMPVRAETVRVNRAAIVIVPPSRGVTASARRCQGQRCSLANVASHRLRWSGSSSDLACISEDSAASSLGLGSGVDMQPLSAKASAAEKVKNLG